MTKMGGTHCGKNGWHWCYRHHGTNGWSSLWQKWVELSMKEWVELTVAKIGGTGVKDTVTKMGGAHCGKNGWSSQ